MAQRTPRPRLPEMPSESQRPSSRIRAGLCVHERVRASGELEAQDDEPATQTGSAVELTAHS